MSKIPNRIPNRLGGRAVRLRYRWRGYPAGEILRPPGALRSMLIGDGIAEPFQEQPAADDSPDGSETLTDSPAGDADGAPTGTAPASDELAGDGDSPAAGDGAAPDLFDQSQVADDAGAPAKNKRTRRRDTH